jgi:hypothetical protein
VFYTILQYFNAPLVTLGDRLQKINPETLQLVKVYETVTECMNENYSMKRPSITKSSEECTVYNGFRWKLVPRGLVSSSCRKKAEEICLLKLLIELHAEKL